MGERIRSAEEARAYVRRHGLVTLASDGDFPALATAVAGAPVPGSWWGHPKGKAIFNWSEAVHDAGDVVVMKLVAGKVTFVHEALWPALARVVLDGAWRAKAAEGLDAGARVLLDDVERAGEVALDDAPGDAKAKAKRKSALEARALVLATQVHTESGRHATVLRSWSAWATRELRSAAERLALDQALEQLRDRARGRSITLEAAPRAAKPKKGRRS